jgi:hypothetical protein
VHCGFKDERDYPVMLIGLIGAALFYGDGVITPAISVLSAVEGLEVVSYPITATTAVSERGHRGENFCAFFSGSALCRELRLLRKPPVKVTPLRSRGQRPAL